ncbi:MAG: type II secretion system protein [Clostridiales bacterium]|nr:type II secretion system protein [Clostridiales bacterium]
MKKIMNNKRGFTLVEIVCTIAIIVTLASVTSLGIHDYIRNAETAGDMVIQARGGEELVQMEAEVFGSNGQAWASPEVIEEAPQKSQEQIISEVNKATIGGDIDNGITEAAAMAQATPEKPEEPERDFNANIAAARDMNPSYYDGEVARLRTLLAGATPIPGTEDIDIAGIIAAAETLARETYKADYIDSGSRDYNKTKYYTYCPATGELKLANGNGKSMEAWNGQNFTRANLEEISGSRNIAVENYDNVRFSMDRDFFLYESNSYRVVSTTGSRDSSNVIYIGVKGNSAKTNIEVIPAICIDVNGHINTVNTPAYTDGNWDAYRKFVQGTTGHLLDTSSFEQWSQSTGRVFVGENNADKATWQAYLDALRNGWTPS